MNIQKINQEAQYLTRIFQALWHISKEKSSKGIAIFLQRRHIKGSDGAISCPLAVYVSKATKLKDVHVDNDHIILPLPKHMAHFYKGGEIKINLGRAFRKFIQDFDAGKYPELKKPERKSKLISPEKTLPVELMNNIIPLHQLRESAQQFNRKWKDQGGKMTTYKCGHCQAVIETRQPSPADVNEKGYWDSMTTCTSCGKLNFVCVFPDGKAAVNS